MSENKHWTVTTAELARDLTIASSAKHPSEMAAAFRLLYLSIQKAALESDQKDLDSQIADAQAKLTEAEPKM